jgi:hypothetical protein
MTTQDKFARKFVDLIAFAERNGIKVLCTSLWRNAVTQARMFKEGTSKADGVTNISKHQLGCAADLVVLNNNGQPIWKLHFKYNILGTYWESLGGKWGHRWFEQGKTQFDDIYHFEM